MVEVTHVQRPKAVSDTTQRWQDTCEGEAGGGCQDSCPVSGSCGWMNGGATHPPGKHQERPALSPEFKACVTQRGILLIKRTLDRPDAPESGGELRLSERPLA